MTRNTVLKALALSVLPFVAAEAQASIAFARSTINMFKGGGPTVYQVQTDVGPVAANVTDRHEEDLNSLRANAQGATSNFLDVHTSASITRGGYASAQLSQLNRGTLLLTRGEAEYNDIVTSKSAFHANIGFYFERDLEYRLLQNDFFYKEALSYIGAKPFEKHFLSSIEILSSAYLFIDKWDSDSGKSLGTVATYFIDDGWGHNTLVYNTDIPGQLLYDVRQSGSRQEYRSYFNRDGNEVFDDIFIDTTADWGGERDMGALHVADDYFLPARFENGTDYLFTFGTSCEVRFNGIAVFSTSSWGICDASRSLYWTGLSDIEAISGSIADASLISKATGFDYRNPSPRLAAAVPEPSAWAMLIAGFAMTGHALRRSRKTARGAQAVAGELPAP